MIGGILALETEKSVSIWGLFLLLHPSLRKLVFQWPWFLALLLPQKGSLNSFGA